jgi:hypothetical protein
MIVPYLVNFGRFLFKVFSTLRQHTRMRYMRDYASVLVVTMRRSPLEAHDLRLSIGEAVDRHINGIEEHLAWIEFNRQE